MSIVVEPSGKANPLSADELVEMFLKRGFDYKSNAEGLQYINDAYLVDICDAEDWPFLEAVAEGPSPVEILSLGHVEEVLNPSQRMKLEPLRRSRITETLDTDLATAGTPNLYYISEGNTVNVYPHSAETLVVRYVMSPEAISEEDVPIIPARFHSLIVDAAVARAYEDSDDYELAENAETKFQRRLEKMREALLYPQHDGPDEFVVITDPEAC